MTATLNWFIFIGIFPRRRPTGPNPDEYSIRRDWEVYLAIWAGSECTSGEAKCFSDLFQTENERLQQDWLIPEVQCIMGRNPWSVFRLGGLVSHPRKMAVAPLGRTGAHHSPEVHASAIILPTCWPFRTVGPVLKPVFASFRRFRLDSMIRSRRRGYEISRTTKPVARQHTDVRQRRQPIKCVGWGCRWRRNGVISIV